MYACMHLHTYIYIHIKYFSVPLENLFYDKEKVRNYHSLEQGPSVICRLCVAIAACNKQLPARLATSLTGRPHLVARLY